MKGLLLAGVLALVALSAQAAKNFTLNSAAGGWWGTPGNWSSSTLPGVNESGILIGANNNTAKRTYFAYLKDGDNYSYTNATLSISGSGNTTANGAVYKLLIPTNATLTVKDAYMPYKQQGAVGSTSILEVAGGTLKLGSNQALVLGGKSSTTSILKLKDTTFTGLSTVAWLANSVGEVYADHATVTVVNNGIFILAANSPTYAYLDMRNGSKLNCGQMLIGSNVATAAADIVAVDSQIVTSDRADTGTVKYFLLTNSTFLTTGGSKSFTIGGSGTRYEMIGSSTNRNFQYVQANSKVNIRIDGEKAYLQSKALLLYPSGASVTQRMEIVDGFVNMTHTGGSGVQHGIVFGKGVDAPAGTGMATIRQTGGTVQSYALTFSTAGTHHPRYEITGGTFTLLGNPGGIYQAKIAPGRNASTGLVGTSGTFSMQGSAPDVSIADFKCDTGLVHLEYVIDRTGAPCMKRPYDNSWGYSACNWIQGAHSARLAGGLQLLHTNVYAFIDSHTTGYPSGNDLKGYTSKPAQYCDLNGAARHLWTFGPHADASSNPTGVLAGTKTFGAKLNANEEIVPETRYEDGRAFGWVRVPMLRQKPKFCRVLMDVVPQGGRTLAEIADGMTAAGYETKVLTSGTYNLQVSLPVDDLRLGSTNERVAFDFADYNSAEAVRDDTPEVRALVRQVKVDRSRTGLLIVFR